MKNISVFLMSLLMLAISAPNVLAKKAKEPPICTYGKVEFINSKKVYRYKTSKACTLKQGAKWLCRKKQKKGHRQLKKMVRMMTDNMYSKVSYKLTPFSYKGNNRRQGKRCKLTIRQLTCRYVSCNFN